MKPRLKSAHSPDADDLEHFAPVEPDCFGILVQLMIGPEDQEGEESFDIVVCTSGWLEKRARECGIVDLRHHLLVDAYKWRAIRRHVEGFLAGVEEDSWEAIAARVGRLGRWEFEDYQAPTPSAG